MEKNVNFKVTADTGDAQKSLGQLEAEFDSLNEAIRQVPQGSAEFKELQKQLTATGREIKNVELAFESLDNEQVASEIGSVAGAVGDVSAAFILLGDDSEELQKVAQNIEKALGVSMAFKGAIEGISSARKLLNNSTIVQNGLEKISTFLKITSAGASGTLAAAETTQAVATEATTAAMGKASIASRVLAFAMSAIPIFAIITGLTLLVGAFIYFYDEIKKIPKYLQEMYWRFQELGTVMKVVISILFPMIGMYYAIAEALEYYGVIDDKETAQRKQRLKEMREAQAKATKEKIDAINKEIEANRKLTEEVSAAIDFEIEKKQAAGEDYTALEKEKITMLIRSAQQEIALINQKIEAKQKELELYSEGVQQWLSVVTEGYEKEKAEQEKVLLEQTQALELWNIKQTKLQKDQIKKSSDERKKANEKEVADEKKKQDDLFKARQKAYQDERTLREQQTRLYQDLTFTDQEKELRDLAEQYDKKYEIAKGNKLLLELLEDEHQKKIAGINEKYAILESEAKAQEIIEDRELNEEKYKLRLEDAEKLVGALSGLNSKLMEAELNMAGDNEEKKNEIRKKAFARDKALKLAQATIDGIRSVQAALTIPPPLGFVLAALNGATAAANIAAIASAKFEGVSGGSGGGSLPNTGRATSGARVDQVTNTTTTIGEPTKVYVTEQDISSTQGKVKVAESQASL